MSRLDKMANLPQAGRYYNKNAMTGIYNVQTQSEWNSQNLSPLRMFLSGLPQMEHENGLTHLIPPPTPLTFWQRVWKFWGGK